MQLWAVLFPTSPPSKNLSNSQLSGPLSVNYFGSSAAHLTTLPHEGWTSCVWKRSKCSGSPVRASQLLVTQKTPLLIQKEKPWRRISGHSHGGKEFREMEGKGRTVERQEERWEDQAAGRDMRCTREEPRIAALSVEPRVLTPQNSPSWLRRMGRMGTCTGLLCAKHRGQTEGNVSLWLPLTSGQRAGLHPGGRASRRPTASGHPGQSGERGPSSPPSCQ